MNLKIKTQTFELEIQNGDKAQIEKTLLATFAYIQDGSFVDTYNATEVEERPVNSKRNFVPTVDGKKIFNGEEHYQCSYSCGCGNRGKRFIKNTATTITCHQCNQTLQVQKAHEDGSPDHEFNYFIAY